MKVFYDTNIILEYLFRRKEGEIVRTILLWSQGLMKAINNDLHINNKNNESRKRKLL